MTMMRHYWCLDGGIGEQNSSPSDNKAGNTQAADKANGHVRKCYLADVKRALLCHFGQPWDLNSLKYGTAELISETMSSHRIFRKMKPWKM